MSGNPIDEHVGNRVRIARRSNGFSQHRVANDLGLTFQQVQKYERGLNRISASKLFELSTSLDRPVAWFFEGLDQARDRGMTQQEHDAHEFYLTREGQEIARQCAHLPPETVALFAKMVGQFHTHFSD